MSGFTDDIVSHIFSPDPLASLRYHDTHVSCSGAAKDVALRRLMLAVLADAIGCLQAHFSKPSRTRETRFHEAEEWIVSDADGAFSFNTVCEGLGLDANSLRKRLLRWKQEQIQVKPLNPATDLRAEPRRPARPRYRSRSSART
ncbi:MAG: hypothetical protein ACREQK_05405 [Candidatus Binatia bacterium]